MKKIIKIFLLILFLLLISIVFAQNEEWDYEDDEIYDSEEFYKESDPSQWDYNSVDWSKVDFDREDIYNVQEFYNNLPDDKYGSIRYNLISNYDLINHNKIHGDKYFQDLGCNNCRLSYAPREGYEEEFNLIKYSERGITHVNGDYMTIPGNYQDVFVDVTSDGIEVWFIRKDTMKNVISIPLEDSLILKRFSKMNTIKTPLKLKYGDEEFRLEYGEILLKDKKIFITNDYMGAKVDGVEIYKRGNTFTRLFFDGEEHQNCDCYYISMNREKKVIISRVDDNHRMIIKEPFILAQAQFEITQRFGTMKLENREDKGLIPSIIMEIELDEVTQRDGLLKDEPLQFNKIINGKSEIYVYEDGTIKEAVLNEGESKSNPLVLSVKDTEGKSLIGSNDEPKRLIIDDDNRISSIDYNQLSSSEQSRLYFSFTGYAKVVMDRAAEARKNIRNLKTEIEEKRGVAPMNMLGWIDDPREGRIINAIRDASAKSGLSEEFVTATAFQEGLNVFMEDKYYKNQDSEFYSNRVLGLIYFGSEIDSLKKRGFIRKDFQEYRVTEPNKKGRTFPTFDNVDFALEAFAGILKQRRSDFLRWAESKDYNINELSDDQVDYWTYVSFNCGEGCMKNTINDDGIEIPKGYIERGKVGKAGSRKKVWNAKRVLATQDLIRVAGLFDKEISEEIDIAMK